MTALSDRHGPDPYQLDFSWVMPLHEATLESDLRPCQIDAFCSLLQCERSEQIKAHPDLHR